MKSAIADSLLLLMLVAFLLAVIWYDVRMDRETVSIVAGANPRSLIIRADCWFQTTCADNDVRR